jgi:hypothetical protein
MYGPTIIDPFRPLISGASSESWAQLGCRPKSHCDSVISVMYQTTFVRSYWKCLALWVMHRQRGEGTECMCVNMET